MISKVDTNCICFFLKTSATATATNSENRAKMIRFCIADVAGRRIGLRFDILSGVRVVRVVCFSLHVGSSYRP